MLPGNLLNLLCMDFPVLSESRDPKYVYTVSVQHEKICCLSHVLLQQFSAFGRNKCNLCAVFYFPEDNVHQICGHHIEILTFTLVFHM